MVESRLDSRVKGFSYTKGRPASQVGVAIETITIHQYSAWSIDNNCLFTISILPLYHQSDMTDYAFVDTPITITIIPMPRPYIHIHNHYNTALALTHNSTSVDKAKNASNYFQYHDQKNHHSILHCRSKKPNLNVANTKKWHA
jgi:hypothetical protein